MDTSTCCDSLKPRRLFVYQAVHYAAYVTSFIVIYEIGLGVKAVKDQLLTKLNLQVSVPIKLNLLFYTNSFVLTF